jgi:cytochrome c-type biogenesis protein CcmH/NrfF
MTSAWVLAFVWLAMAVAPSTSERVQRLGERLKCMCGCNQILTQCNHVGCTVSARMLRELNERVGRNESDDLTLQSFVQEYGPEVAIVPKTRGFDLTAWAMPGVALATGIVLVLWVLSRWRRGPAAVEVGAVQERHLAQARRETED